MPGRSAAQLSRKPGEWHDYQAEERRRTLAALTADLRRARESGEEWYRWIAEGCPPLTLEEYEARGGRHARRRPASSSPLTP